MAEAERTEKITLNLGLVDLGRIDLLVQEGFYANRTDFLRTAARAQLAVHANALQQAVDRKTIVLGLELHPSAARRRSCGRRPSADSSSRPGHDCR